MPVSLRPHSHLMATNQKMKKNVQAINKKAQTTNIKDLQCFLGMLNYLNKYTPRLAEHAYSLRDLTKKNVPFICEPE